MKRVRNMLCMLLGLVLALNMLLPGHAQAATSPDMSGWTTEDGATYRTFSNAAGVSRVEFSDWSRMGENYLQFSQDLSLDDAKADISDSLIVRGHVGGGPSGVVCYSIDNEELGPMSAEAAQRLRDARIALTWPDGVYTQDGTAYPLTLTFTNFEVDLEDGEALSEPLRFVRTFDEGTLEVNAYYNTTSGGKGIAFDVLMQVGLPGDTFEEGASMVFTATDLDISDKSNKKDHYDATYGKNGVTHYARFAESVELLGGVLGTVYLEDKTYGDFEVANENNQPLYGDAASGRFINIERLEGRVPANPSANNAAVDPNILVREPGTWFSSTRQTSGADQTKASGFATLVDPSGFKFRWRGSNCGTTLFAQAGLTPELTVRNVGSFPDKIRTTDDQLKDADPYNMPANLYVNPTTPERLSHTYDVHWKSQKSVTAEAEPGYRVLRVHLERDVAGELTRRSIDVADLQVGVETPFDDGLAASTVTLNDDGTVTVRVADEDPTGEPGATGFMNDYTLEFEAVDDVLDIAVEKEWVGEAAHQAEVTLYRNDAPVDTAVLSAEGGWRYVFAHMPELDGQGDPYDYRLEETPVPGYESRVSGNAHEGFLVTNYATNETVDLAGTKVWDDADDAAGLRPDSITLRAWAGGQEVARTTTSAADGWAWSFAGLPKYDRGALVEYQITEDYVEGYSTAYDAQTGTFTNTHMPETRSIAVSKAWLHGDLTPMEDTSGLAPVSVELHRVVDAAAGVTEPVAGQELVLTHEGGWSGFFVDVPVLVDGEPAQYTVYEVPVEGYTSEVAGDADQGFTLVNRQNASEVRLQKLAADTGEPLAGAWLTLRDAEGMALTTWETDAADFVCTLVPGTYTLEERRAPEGYFVADPVEFTVGYDGSVSVGGAVVEVVRMTDEPVPPLVPEGDPDDGGVGPEEDGGYSITPTDKQTWGRQGEPQTQDAHEMFDSDDEIVRLELIDPETGEPAADPIPARDEDGNQVGTYEIDADGLITFTPNADFVGTAVPATVRATTASGLVSEARYMPHVVGEDTPLPNTGTTTTTTTSPQPGTTTTTTSSKALPTTADVSLPALFYTIGAAASIGFALVLRKRY